MIAIKSMKTTPSMMSPFSLFIVASIYVGLFGLDFFNKEDKHNTSSTTLAESNAEHFVDCLWYVARNHGFYMIQREIALRRNDEISHTVWHDFVQTTGIAECGKKEVNNDVLVDALSTSLQEADAYFFSSQ